MGAGHGQPGGSVTFTPTDGSVTNAKVSASAAIDLTKLASTGVVGSGCFEIVSATAVSVHNGAGLVVGHTAKLTVGAADEFQVLGTAAADSRALLGRFSADALGPDLDFLKSRHATLGSNTIVQDNDVLGRLCFYPADGANFATLAASFRCEVDDASPAAGDVGCAFVWSMMPGGGGAIADKLQLTAAGALAPCANDGLTLGTTTLGFADVHLATGGVINWANGLVTLSHTAGADALEIQSGKLGIGTSGTVSAELHVLDASLANGAAAAVLIFSGGADGVHGPVNVVSGVYPSATGSERYGYLQVQDGSAYRDLVLGPSGGNVGIGTAAWGTNAVKVLSIGTGTAPTTGPADTVQFYSSDIAAGHTMPSFFCEGTQVLATGQADSVSSVRVKMRINGTEVTLLAI